MRTTARGPSVILCFSKPAFLCIRSRPERPSKRNSNYVLAVHFEKQIMPLIHFGHYLLTIQVWCRTAPCLQLVTCLAFRALQIVRAQYYIIVMLMGYSQFLLHVQTTCIWGASNHLKALWPSKSAISLAPFRSNLLGIRFQTFPQHNLSAYRVQ